MHASGSGGPRGERAGRVRLAAADCPLAIFTEEHFLQRQICADMETLADAQVPRPDLAAAVLEHVCHDLPQHLADEEQGLFPLLRARAAPEDEIDVLIARLEADHEVSEAAFFDLADVLEKMTGGALPVAADRTLLRASAAARRRHLILENAVLLPLARARLTGEDRAGLLAQMRARRSASPQPVPAPAPCACRTAPAPEETTT